MGFKVKKSFIIRGRCKNQIVSLPDRSSLDTNALSLIFSRNWSKLKNHALNTFLLTFCLIIAWVRVELIFVRSKSSNDISSIFVIKFQSWISPVENDLKCLSAFECPEISQKSFRFVRLISWISTVASSRKRFVLAQLNQLFVKNQNRFFILNLACNIEAIFCCFWKWKPRASILIAVLRKILLASTSWKAVIRCLKLDLDKFVINNETWIAIPWNWVSLKVSRILLNIDFALIRQFLLSQINHAELFAVIDKVCSFKF